MIRAVILKVCSEEYISKSQLGCSFTGIPGYGEAKK